VKRIFSLSVAVLSLGWIACPSSVHEGPNACDWTQFGHDFTHGGAICAPGQALSRKLDQFVFDPFVSQEIKDGNGTLTVHYQTPLVTDDGFYMSVKGGSYVACTAASDPSTCGGAVRNGQTWGEARFTFGGDGKGVQAWRFESDWKPVPAALSAWEPVFQPALWRDVLWVPGAGGSLFRVDRHTGAQLGRVNPFVGGLDPDVYAVGGLAVDADGNVYYHALKVDPSNPLVSDVRAWMVKVTSEGVATVASFDTLVPGAPKATELCRGVFPRNTPRPLPPPPDASGAPAQPPSAPCLSQRPPVSITPAIATDGTVYTVSRAHAQQRVAYLLALHPDLTPKWSASLQDRLDDGCGVKVACRTGATLGVDPSTNARPAGIATDTSTSSPVALPDGSVVYGAFTSYNGARGHLMHFDASGHYLNAFDFGWDMTPAVYRHDGTFSLIVKNNDYFTWETGGPYNLSRLDKNLQLEWSFLSTNTDTCKPNAAGALECVTDHPGGFEWCVNAPAVDPEGTVYVNSEDGYLYAIDRQGKQKARIFLNLALGAAYTPVALDAQGRIYALNGGVLTVVGR